MTLNVDDDESGMRSKMTGEKLNCLPLNKIMKILNFDTMFEDKNTIISLRR